MSKQVRIDLTLLLPDLPDQADECVRRLETMLGSVPGIERVHVAHKDGMNLGELCLHFDPARVSVKDVQQLARSSGAQIGARYAHLSIPLQVIGAEDAGMSIERALMDLPGVLNVLVSLPAQQALIEFDRQLTDAKALREKLDALGVAAARPAAPGVEPSVNASGLLEWYRRHRELAWSLGSGLFLVTGFGLEHWSGASLGLVVTLYLCAYLLGGLDLIKHWSTAVLSGRVTFDIHLLMLLAAIGAAVLGAWAEGAFLLFLFSLAHALEHAAMGRARDAIRALGDLAPRSATIQRGEGTVSVPVEQVRPFDIVIVRSGESVPVDGEVTAGSSSVNQAPITGESVPVAKAAGDEVFAGTINGDGVLHIQATRVVGDRTLDRVVKLVAEAQVQKAPTQLFTERFERIFVPVVLVADVLLIVIPPLIGAWDLSTSFYRGMALLVAASPCALALGTPAAVLTGIAQAARSGVLIKGGAHLENLGQLRALALDKTGTLTEGHPEVTDLRTLSGTDEGELLRVAAGIEQHSQHPLAAAVVRAAEQRGVTPSAASDVQSVTGRGVRGVIDGTATAIGTLELWESSGGTIPEEIRREVEELQAGGRSTMAVEHGGRWLGVLGVADRPREGVADTLNQLRALGIGPIVMLTGDNAGVGNAVGQEVGVDEVRSRLLPEDKVTAIRELSDAHGQVAMVGDGVNDAPALANATVGIAMGGAGTAIALETADVALMADDLGKLVFAVGLSRQARAVIRQNLYISLTVIGTLVLATTTGVSGIGLAVLVHEGSTLVVVANALRLLRYSG
ncbi:MAG TPA: heavy metal translocating P-type ATPase [Gemmatimonadales bacterium]|nr:heavy metal translocating P-type ATPase [Gemmatimonadales bacterium]